MATFIVTNQHQPEDCPELNDEVSSFYEAKKPAEASTVYCNCGLGEHRVTFLIDAAGPSEALGAVPPGFLRSATTVSQVDQVYKYAGRSG